MGALFGKHCARHGALASLRAHFLKMGAPDFLHVLNIFGRFYFPFTWSISFIVYKVHYAGWSASGKIREFHNFQIRENQRISPFLKNFRDTSGDFIMDKGENQEYIIIFCLISLKMHLDYTR